MPSAGTVVILPSYKSCLVNETFNWRIDTDCRGSMLIKYFMTIKRCLANVPKYISVFEVTTTKRYDFPVKLGMGIGIE